MEDLAIFVIYMGFLGGFVGLAGLLCWITEKVPFLNRLVNRWIDSMTLADYDDDEEYWEDDEDDWE